MAHSTRGRAIGGRVIAGRVIAGRVIAGGVKTIGATGSGQSAPRTGHPDEPILELPARMDGSRAPDSRSGTWKIRWQGGTDASDVYVNTFLDLFERQLNSFKSPRVFLLGDVRSRNLSTVHARSRAVVVGENNALRSPEFDVAWDAGFLSRAQLPERLRLVQALDDRLKIGGACIIVTHGKHAADDAFASLSPEEIAAYFFPAYVVSRHEEHEFALPPGKPVSFHTLVLVKQSPLTSEMLDPELHRSLHAVASRRRGMLP